MLFADRPPSLRDVSALAEAGGRFSVSHGDPSMRWAELLMTGLTFDFGGLGDSARVAPEVPEHAFGGIDAGLVRECHMAVLDVGPHLRGAGGMIPVARAMCELACLLTALAGCRGVIWRPAAVAMTPSYFSEVVARWLAGGPFPALGLTSLVIAPDGAVVSDGLAHFVGRELRLLPTREPPAQRVKLAIRLVSHIIDTGDAFEQTLVGPNGHSVILRPGPAGGYIEAVQQGA